CRTVSPEHQRDRDREHPDGLSHPAHCPQAYRCVRRATPDRRSPSLGAASMTVLLGTSVAGPRFCQAIRLPVCRTSLPRLHLLPRWVTVRQRQHSPILQCACCSCEFGTPEHRSGVPLGGLRWNRDGGPNVETRYGRYRENRAVLAAAGRSPPPRGTFGVLANLCST